MIGIWSNGPGTPGTRSRLPSTPNDVNDCADVRDDPCLDASECVHAERTYRRHGTPSRECVLTRSRHSGTRDEPTTRHRPAGVARRPHDIGSAAGPASATWTARSSPDATRCQRARRGGARWGDTGQQCYSSLSSARASIRARRAAAALVADLATLRSPLASAAFAWVS